MVNWPDDFHQSFHIFAHGEKFNVEDFLRKSSLRPHSEWRRDPPLTSGVEFLLGDGHILRLREQKSVALTYLKTHRDELRAVAVFPGVETFILGLVYTAKLGGGVTGAALDWDRDLMLAALDVGITPIHYVSYEFPPKPDHEPSAMFYSTGEFEPDDITRRLGVTPSEVARVGTSVGKSRIKRRNALWTLHSRLDPSVGPVDLHVADVLDQLDTNRAKFDAFISEFGGVIEIVGLSENYGPPVSLDPEIVRRLAQYRLTLNVVRG